MTFDIDLVKNSFQECHESELNIPAYLKGYSELYNFFNVLGSVFGFIASDVKEKIDILVSLLSLLYQVYSNKYCQFHIFLFIFKIKVKRS